MKRNHPLDGSSSASAIEEEGRIVDQRLDEHYSSNQVRKVLRSNIASYCDEHHHLRLDPHAQPNHYDGLSQYSNELAYHFLDPYPALFLMESRQILIHYNELPLSLAEAYCLLLRDQNEFQHYIVFSNLNRNGYFCLESNNRSQQRVVDQVACPRPINDNEFSSTTLPLFEIDDCKLTYSEVLDRLREQGPKDLTAHQLTPRDSNIVISFDAYKRETFSKKKPRRDQPGEPDYYVVIRHKNKTTSPSCFDFLSLGDESACNKLLFAIIDNDSSLSFNNYASVEM